MRAFGEQCVYNSYSGFIEFMQNTGFNQESSDGWLSIIELYTHCLIMYLQIAVGFGKRAPNSATIRLPKAIILYSAVCCRSSKRIYKCGKLGHPGHCRPDITDS